MSSTCPFLLVSLSLSPDSSLFWQLKKKAVFYDRSLNRDDEEVESEEEDEGEEE